MLRCRSIASLQCTVSTPPLVDFSRASHLDLFEQPAGGFFQHPARPALILGELCRHSARIRNFTRAKPPRAKSFGISRFRNDHS
jgi:hypothetical protein